MAVKDAGPRQLVAALPVNKLREAEESAERPKSSRAGGPGRWGVAGAALPASYLATPAQSSLSVPAPLKRWHGARGRWGFLTGVLGAKGLLGLRQGRQRRSETAAQRCFCQVSGYVDNCTCVVETMDRLND